MTAHDTGRSKTRATVWSALALALACSLAGSPAVAQPKPQVAQTAPQSGLRLNDSEYFATRGLNVFVFTNQYNGMFFDEKTAGIEMIQHGVRLATGGAVRLSPTPEQWDQIPKLVDRKVDKATNTITCVLRYEAFDFDSRLVVTPDGAGFRVAVYVDTPVPEKLEGRAGLNLEFLPSRYFERTYLADGRPGQFPRHPIGPAVVRPADTKIQQFEGYTTFEDRGRNEYVEAAPVAVGKKLILAAEDPERRTTIQALSGELQLLDGRNLAQNGWFIVRSLLATKATGKVAEWVVLPNIIPNWTRTPVIGFSQVGYHPAQKKVAIIEHDANDAPLATASLFEVTGEGAPVERLKAKVQPWGQYLRYNYATVDFSAVNRPGLYFIQYGKEKTETFPIGPNVYDAIWHATADVWFPVQMDHMMVNEAYRVWHGLPHMDDALADECLALAKKADAGERQAPAPPPPPRPAGAPALPAGAGARFGAAAELAAVAQLMITTKEQPYIDRFNELIWPSLEGPGGRGLLTAVRALPYLGPGAVEKLRPYVVKYRAEVDGLAKANPYGVPIATGGWAGSGGVMGWATTNYFLHKTYPDLFDQELVYRGLHFLFGTHPASNVSLVATVGTRSKRLAYGTNRADFAFIPGVVVPGVLILKPDFPEHMDDWPYLWGENEGTIGGASQYIFLSLAAKDLIGK